MSAAAPHSAIPATPEDWTRSMKADRAKGRWDQIGIRNHSPLNPNFVSAETVDAVVVDDSDGLHPGINDHGPDELESPLLEGFGDFFREWGAGRRGSMAGNWFAAREFPYKG